MDNRGINACSRFDTSFPLIVNCAGVFSTSYCFCTNNPSGRLDYYLIYLTSGSLNLNLAGEHLVAKAGDTVIIPPECPYMYTFSGDGSLSYYWVHFTGSAAELYLKEIGLHPSPAVYSPVAECRASASLYALLECFSEGGQLLSPSLGAILLRVLTEIGKSLVKSTNAAISESVRYINAHYTEQLRIPTLAAMDNLSNSRYHTVFKSIMGKAPTEYILELRIKHACELLATTDMSVKQIGAMVGYPDPHFFNKAFRSVCGVPPGSYRKL